MGISSHLILNRKMNLIFFLDDPGNYMITSSDFKKKYSKSKTHRFVLGFNKSITSLATIFLPLSMHLKIVETNLFIQLTIGE